MVSSNPLKLSLNPGKCFFLCFFLMCRIRVYTCSPTSDCWFFCESCFNWQRISSHTSDHAIDHSSWGSSSDSVLAGDPLRLSVSALSDTRTNCVMLRTSRVSPLLPAWIFLPLTHPDFIILITIITVTILILIITSHVCKTPVLLTPTLRLLRIGRSMKPSSCSSSGGPLSRLAELRAILPGNMFPTGTGPVPHWLLVGEQAASSTTNHSWWEDGGGPGQGGEGWWWWWWRGVSIRFQGDPCPPRKGRDGRLSLKIKQFQARALVYDQNRFKMKILAHPGPEFGSA